MSANAVNLNTQTGSDVTVNAQTESDVTVNAQTESEVDKKRKKKRRNSFLKMRQKAAREAAHARRIKGKMRNKYYAARGALG